MQLVLQCDFPAASLLKENIEGGKKNQNLLFNQKIWVVSMLWTV